MFGRCDQEKPGKVLCRLYAILETMDNSRRGLLITSRFVQCKHFMHPDFISTILRCHALLALCSSHTWVDCDQIDVDWL